MLYLYFLVTDFHHFIIPDYVFYYYVIIKCVLEHEAASTKNKLRCL
jgi:hypothetical protein